MRRGLSWVVLVLLLGVFLRAAPADDTKAKADKDAKTPPAKDKEKNVIPPKTLKGKTTALAGKLVDLDAANQTFKVAVTFTIPDPDLQGMAGAQKAMADASRNRDANGVRSASINYAKAEARTRQETRVIEFQAADNLVVRTMIEPIEFDDKGKPRRLTAKEKRDLKGPDPKLKGYTSDFDSLKRDQIVELFVPKPPKEAARPKPAPKSKSKAKDKDDEPESTEEKERPQVTMIVILADPSK